MNLLEIVGAISIGGCATLAVLVLLLALIWRLVKKSIDNSII